MANLGFSSQIGTYNPDRITSSGYTQSKFDEMNGLTGATRFQDQSMSKQQPVQPTPPSFYDNNPGMSKPTLDPYQKNPYLDQMAAGITDQMNQNWTRNIDPSIRSGAMATGGFGGSRQGVVEANALNDMNRTLGQNLTNLYGQDYEQAQQRNLQKYGMDQGYNLGMASNNLGFAGLDANIYNQNFNNQLNSANFGLNAYNTMMGQGQQGINSATNIQNTPMNYNNYFTGQYNQSGGLGGSGTSSVNMPGNQALGFLGGYQLGSNIKY